MRAVSVFSALAVPVILMGPLAACGRYGPIKSVPGSTYPQSYPNPALAAGAPPAASGPATTDKNQKFTSQGAYIDPSVNVPVIYGTAIVTGLPSGPFTNGFQANQTPGMAQSLGSSDSTP